MSDEISVESNVSGSEAFVLATLTLGTLSLESPAFQQLLLRAVSREREATIYTPAYKAETEYTLAIERFRLELEQLARDAEAGEKRGGPALDAAAKKAVDSLRRRANEDIDDWARTLAESLADVND